MNIQNDPTELIENEANNTRPDRLASALLIIGFIIASLFGSGGVIDLIVAARLPAFMLLMILLGGSGIYYGWFRTVRGSPATKKLFKTTLRKIQVGASSGIAAAFLVFLARQSKGLNLSWLVSFLVLSIVWAVIIGIPTGGIGGLILAFVCKNKKAAFFGGAFSGTIFSFWFFLANFGTL